MFGIAEAVLGCVEEWRGPDADENGRGANALLPAESASSELEKHAEESVSPPAFAFADPAPAEAEGEASQWLKAEYILPVLPHNECVRQLPEGKSSIHFEYIIQPRTGNKDGNSATMPSPTLQIEQAMNLQRWQTSANFQPLTIYQSLGSHQTYSLRIQQASMSLNCILQQKLTKQLTLTRFHRQHLQLCQRSS